MRFEIILIWMLHLHHVRSQATCKSDQDCKENKPCCSSFGYCGIGEGFCAATSGGSPAGTGIINRSGAGCTVDNLEYVGGDMSILEGGGGVNLERNTSQECYNKCEDNFRCRWFTYDERERLCYLKNQRGYPRNRTDGFISGSKEREGCNRDQECRPPYSYYSDQCMFYCEEEAFNQVSIADIRRNYNQSQEFCEKYGGFLPYEFQGSGGYQYSDQYHWLGYRGDEGNCWAGRPGYGSQGVQSFPCTNNLNFACQQKGLYPPVVPTMPPQYTPAYTPHLSPPHLQGRAGWSDRGGAGWSDRGGAGWSDRGRMARRRALRLIQRRYLLSRLGLL